MSMPGRGWMELPPDPEQDPVLPARAIGYALLFSLPIWIVIGLIWWFSK